MYIFPVIELQLILILYNHYEVFNFIVINGHQNTLGPKKI